MKVRDLFGSWQGARARAAILYNSEPIEIAQGRGDLRFTSGYFGNFPAAPVTQQFVGGRVISYANLFAEQAIVAVAVMRLLTWAARVPLKVWRQVEDDQRVRVRPGDHPLADAIQTPWERAATLQLVGSFLGSLEIHGNALVGVDEGARGAIRFDPFDWRGASPLMPYESNTIAGWDITRDGDTSTYSADSTVHVAWYSPLGPIGVSPLAQLGTTVVLEDAARRYQTSYMGNSARPESYVSPPEGVVIDKDVRDTLREEIHSVYGGPDNSGKPLLLPGGFKWEAVGHTAHEAELVEQRLLNRKEVAAVYQIPPPMLGILDEATYSNIETQREMAYTDGLAPPLILIEELLTAQLVRGLLREPDLYVEFDFGPILRGDRLKEIEALRGAVSMMMQTPNEARAVLGLPRSDAEGADELWAPSINNLQPMDAPVTAPPVPPA